MTTNEEAELDKVILNLIKENDKIRDYGDALACLERIKAMIYEEFIEKRMEQEEIVEEERLVGQIRKKRVRTEAS